MAAWYQTRQEVMPSWGDLALKAQRRRAICALRRAFLIGWRV